MTKQLLVVCVMIFIYQTILSAESNNNKKVSAKDSLNTKTSNSLNYNRDYEPHLTWYQMFTNVPHDDFQFFKNLVEKPRIPTYIGLTALTGSLMAIDHSGWKLDDHLYSNSHLFHSTSNVLVFMGNGEFHFMLSGLFGAYGFIGHDQVALKTASNIAESVLAAGLLVQVLKRITGRESPAGSDKTLGSWKFFPSIKEYQKNQSKYYSFPSGHLASATATLTVILNNYPQIKWLKPVGYTLLGCLGISLVSQGMHWYSDLPLGFFIGYSIGNIISPLKSETQTVTTQNNSHLILMPNIGLGKLGLNVAYTF